MSNQLCHDHEHEASHEMFEHFTSACIANLTAKDPITGEHSERVAELTVNLAVAVNRTTTGAYAAIEFSDKQIQEIKVASLFHDFGKMCIDDSILQKEKKLFSHELERIQNRFRSFPEKIYSHLLETYLENLILKNQTPTVKDLAKIQEEVAIVTDHLEEFYADIVEANEPSHKKHDVSHKIQHIAQAHTTLLQANRFFQRYHCPLLTSDEIQTLSLNCGTLSEEERREMESHVTYAYQFLIKIPWAQHLKAVPEIVYNHHERLDGSGYPRQLKNDQIPVQAKMMAITDIFDALIALDRPYKKSIPYASALDILNSEVNSGKLDGDLFKIFVEAGVGL